MNDLVEMIEGSVDADAAKDEELVDFTSCRIELDFFDVLSHAERLLLVLQKWRMTGEQDTVEILKKEGVGAIKAEINRDIAAGHLPAWAFFDLAAWESAAEESEYGRLLNIQDLPDSAKLFFCSTIDISAFQIDPALDGQPDYELGLFVESYTYLNPEEITGHMTRLLLECISDA